MTAKSRMLTILVALLFVQLGAARVWGQSGGLQSGGVGYRSPYSGSLYYLRLPQVEKELELAEYQQEKIKELREKITADMRDGYAKLRDLPREERTKKYYEQLNELSANVEKQLQKILLDHQCDRLKQVSLQLSLRYRGVASALGQSELSEALGISEKQQEELREKRDEMNKKLQQEYQRLRKEAQQELLEAVLTRKQLRELKELMGDDLDSP
jgi:hypothetical protein